MTRVAPGLAAPEYTAFLLEEYGPTGHTREAVEAGSLNRIDCHPLYPLLRCRNPEEAAGDAGGGASASTGGRGTTR